MRCPTRPAGFYRAKQYLFAAVAQRAVRGGAMAAFQHLHRLSLQFHLDRQTGGLTRAIDRGAKGHRVFADDCLFRGSAPVCRGPVRQCDSGLCSASLMP